MNMTEVENIVLEEALTGLPISHFNKYVESDNFRELFRRAVRAKNKHFDSKREYEMFITNLKDKFLTDEQVAKTVEIDKEAEKIKARIKTLRGEQRSVEVKKYNALIDQRNELNKGYKKLVRLYRKYNKVNA